MRKIFQTFVLIVYGALFSGAALATPTLLYEFKLNRLTCVDVLGDGTCGFRYDFLNDMTIGLDPVALAEGQAALRINSDGVNGLREFINDGFSSIALALYSSPARAISLDVNDYTPILVPTFPFAIGRNLDLQVNLAVDRFLKGSLYVNDTSSEIVMGTLKNFAASRVWPPTVQLFDPASENEWTGFIRSDALNSYILPFTGEWKFVGVVPEPGTLALLFAAMAATAWVLRRRVHSVTRPH
ncbi:hypothetical protein CBP36_12170 [Acidovorax carolinensis]|uniref:Ice-binding protein C-terminal domain-containing protein n=1 Tax=Acidovorax carolinensis TaxID=553814 RepID=A0A240UEH5_9BURK|nr:PEP-CTERM sorting domain-containing protein [Acidovorax carolinensis]ART54803.1 hypothetical protein CBP35_06755 [Acidovorax carolinensis]ART59495.1 hypothetical protein CBP36_12170 [Acidovorax carolinensis]